mgnify:CR=1 FL=1
MSTVDKFFEKQIAQNLVKVERKTVWEDLVRICWTIVLGYGAFVLICILVAMSVSPKVKGGWCKKKSP